MLINQPLYFAGPFETGKAMVKVLSFRLNWIILFRSMTRIATGFLLSLVMGSVIALFAYYNLLIKDLLSPFITVLKSVPVASFVVLILAWLSSKYLSVFIAGFVTFPIIYFDVLNCLDEIEPKMLALTKVFRVSLMKKIRFLYVPKIFKRLTNTARISIGMSIRAGIAAELIGIPTGSIGEMIYEAKLYFDIADLFAWTIIIITISYLFEKLMKLCFCCFSKVFGGG